MKIKTLPCTLLPGLIALVILLGSPVSGQTAALYTVEGGNSTLVYDMSGHGHHLTLGSSSGTDGSDPSFSSDTPFPGVNGNLALEFDGADDFVMGPGFFQPGSALSLEMRFKRASADLPHPQVLVSTRGFSGGGFEVRLEVQGTIPRLVFEWWDQTGVSHTHASGYLVLVNHWYRLTIIHDYNGHRTQTILGLDGMAIGIHTVGGPRYLQMEPTASTIFGSNIHGAAGDGPSAMEFRGALDEVRFVHGEVALESILTKRFLSESAGLDIRGNAMTGSTLHFDLASDLDGGTGYVLLPSLGLGTPGTLPLPDGRPLPVSVDTLTLLGLDNLPPFQNSIGTLSGEGRGTASIAIPPVPGLAGLTILAAFLVVDPAAPTGIRRISRARSVTLTR